MARIASATLRPCDTKTSTCRSLATISSGLRPFFAISVLLRLEAIPQDGPPSVIAGGGSSPCCGVLPHVGGRERGAAAATSREDAMVRYAALDVSLETTAICVVGEDGHVVAEGKVRTCPDAIRDFLASRAPGLRRGGFETGPLAVWLLNELRGRQPPAVCLDARHAHAADRKSTRPDSSPATIS